MFVQLKMSYDFLAILNFLGVLVQLNQGSQGLGVQLLEGNFVGKQSVASGLRFLTTGI